VGERERILQAQPHLGQCAACGSQDIVATCAHCGRVICGLCQGVDPQRTEVTLCAACAHQAKDGSAEDAPAPPLPAASDARDIVIPPGCEVLITFREPGKAAADVALRRPKARKARAPRPRATSSSAANSPVWLVLPLACAAVVIYIYLSMVLPRNQEQAASAEPDAPAASAAPVAWAVEKQWLLARLTSEQAWNAHLWADNAGLRARNLELERQAPAAPDTGAGLQAEGVLQQALPYLEWIPPTLTLLMIAALLIYLAVSGGLYTWLCAWLPVFPNRRDFRHFGAAIWRADGRHLAWSAWMGARLPSGRRMDWATWQAFTRMLVRAGVARRVEERSDWAVEAVVERKSALPPLVRWM
jgi:hypothetical protein